jgi:hypothetical protein
MGITTVAPQLHNFRSETLFHADFKFKSFLDTEQVGAGGKQPGLNMRGGVVLCQPGHEYHARGFPVFL